MLAGSAWILSTGSAEALGPTNPVRLTDSSAPEPAANQGFLVFVEDDVSLGGDESEGTVAAGGDLTFTTGYNVAALLSGTLPLRPPTATANRSGSTWATAPRAATAGWPVPAAHP